MKKSVIFKIQHMKIHMEQLKFCKVFSLLACVIFFTTQYSFVHSEQQQILSTSHSLQSAIVHNLTVLHGVCFNNSSSSKQFSVSTILHQAVFNWFLFPFNWGVLCMNILDMLKGPFWNTWPIHFHLHFAIIMRTSSCSYWARKSLLFIVCGQKIFKIFWR